MEQLGRAAWCLTTRLGDLCRPHCKRFFFQRPANIFSFFSHDFCYSHPPIVIAGPLNSILRWVNSQKYLTKIQCREFEGPAMIMMGRKVGDENRGWKNQTDVFDFFGAIFIAHRGSCDDYDGGGVVGWWKSRPKKNRNDVFDFFNRDFCYPISHIDSFENLKFSELFDEDAISQIRRFCDCDG